VSSPAEEAKGEDGAPVGSPASEAGDSASAAPAPSAEAPPASAGVEASEAPADAEAADAGPGPDGAAGQAQEIVLEPLSRRLWRLRADPPQWLALLLGLGGIFVVVAVWAFVTAGGEPHERIVGPLTLAPPGEVVLATQSMFEERHLVQSIAATLGRLFQGFGLAVLVGVPFGIVASAYRPIGAVFAPLVVFGRNVPVAALIPLTVMWFGIGEGQKAFFIFIAAVPFVISDVIKAIAIIPERYVETAQTLGASKAQIITKVLVPQALPDIVTSLRFLFGLAFGYIMLAEAIAAERGLGHLIITSQRRGDVTTILYVIIVIGILAFGIDRGLRFFQRGLFPYRKDIQ
jgi:ABC-type nitrate/sulfonate/bicarbonate transport system permease component